MFVIKLRNSLKSISPLPAKNAELNKVLQVIQLMVSIVCRTRSALISCAYSPYMFPCCSKKEQACLPYMQE